MLNLRKFFLSGCVLLFLTTDLVQSKYVFHPELQRKISQHKQIATWEEAEAHCQSEGATLASPLNAELLKYMRSIIEINNHTTPYFIGIKGRHHVSDAELQFMSEEGLELEDVSSALDLVEQIDAQEGDCLCMDGRAIRVVPCWTRLPYICYSNETTPETSGNTTPTGMPHITPKSPVVTDVPRSTFIDDNPKFCGSGYKFSYDTKKYYKFHFNYIYWAEANTTCSEEGGTLATVDNDNELEIISDMIKIRASFSPNVWIAPSNYTTNSIYDSDTVPQSDEKCPTVYYRKEEVMLMNMPCGNVLPYLCQKEARSCIFLNLASFI